ncbi:hypothetical protein OKJ48_42585 [Streptomyces kunmingensis]|uniref:Uncharacterized protein n=1 Tax=Streptomyces kunmingensis TaxID=68225 RepID=A0ABU6CQC8_9ACTN|nr:hypothetical protein [Streptomyces kunmingensis]MEB3966877.1 hypothetical protein [Streptomyces kunmingensis]
MITTSEPTPLAVTAAARSLAAEAVSLQARITELRRSLALLDEQIGTKADTLRRLRSVERGEVPPAVLPRP